MNSKWLFSGAFAFEASSWALLFANLPVAAAAKASASATVLIIGATTRFRGAFTPQQAA